MDLGIINFWQQSQDRVDSANLRRDRARESAAYADARAAAHAKVARKVVAESALDQFDIKELLAENARLRAENKEYAGHITKLLAVVHGRPSVHQ